MLGPLKAQGKALGNAEGKKGGGAEKQQEDASGGDPGYPLDQGDGHPHPQGIGRQAPPFQGPPEQRSPGTVGNALGQGMNDHGFGDG